MPNMNWIIAMGGTPVDVIIVLMGFAVAWYVFHRDRQQRQDNRDMWSAINRVKQKYAQLDKLTYGIGIAIQKATKIKLFKQSADGKGDHALNRDVE